MIKIILFISIAIFNFANAASNEELEQRVNELTNQIEQINHKYNLLLKKFENLTEDIEIRFKNTEKKEDAKNTSVVAKKANNPQEIKLEFEQAYALIKEQKYDEAEVAFENFIKKYPNSNYTGTAYYWLGESLIMRKRYDKAAVNFIQCFSKFPNNNKADLSILKLGSSLGMLHKKQEACAMLAKLKAKNAKLSPALQQMLQKELNKNKCK